MKSRSLCSSEPAAMLCLVETLKVAVLVQRDRMLEQRSAIHHGLCHRRMEPSLPTPLGNPNIRVIRRFPCRCCRPLQKSVGFVHDKQSMASQRRAPSYLKDTFEATAMLSDSAPPTQALFSLSCLIFADSSFVARARLRRTMASPNRPFLMSSSPFEILNHSVVAQAANKSTKRTVTQAK